MLKEIYNKSLFLYFQSNLSHLLIYQIMKVFTTKRPVLLYLLEKTVTWIILTSTKLERAQLFWAGKIHKCFSAQAGRCQNLAVQDFS